MHGLEKVSMTIRLKFKALDYPVPDRVTTITQIMKRLKFEVKRSGNSSPYKGFWLLKLSICCKSVRQKKKYPD